MLDEHEIRSFLEQSNISKKNITRLRSLASSNDAWISNLANVVLEVARFAPHRRRRFKKLVRERRELVTRMQAVGLMFLLPFEEETHEADFPHYDDPFTAWDEWVEFANSCAELTDQFHGARGGDYASVERPS